jgi:dTDP-4-amino-4,6-dideoxygalactose transaminase
MRRRRSIAARYDELGLETQAVPEGYLHAHHLYVVRSRDRDALRRRLATRGIETLVHYPRAVHQHPGYARLGRAGLDVSERLAAEVVSLPLYPELTDGEVEAVMDALAG